MATTVAKQYGTALPGTYGTPSAANKYVTDADPRLASVTTLEESVEALSSEAVTVSDVLELVRWLSQRVMLLEAVNGTVNAIEPPAEAELLEGSAFEE